MVDWAFDPFIMILYHFSDLKVEILRIKHLRFLNIQIHLKALNLQDVRHNQLIFIRELMYLLLADLIRNFDIK